MITKKNIFSLKQLGYDLKIIERIMDFDPEISLCDLVGILNQKQPEIKSTRHYSLGWKPAKKTVEKLEKQGYLNKTVDNFSSQFLFEISQAKNINPVDIDAYFIKTIKNRIKPITECYLNEWEIEDQVIVAVNMQGLRNKEIQEAINYYKNTAENKKRRHGFQLYDDIINRYK